MMLLHPRTSFEPNFEHARLNYNCCVSIDGMLHVLSSIQNILPNALVCISCCWARVNLNSAVDYRSLQIQVGVKIIHLVFVGIYSANVEGQSDNERYFPRLSRVVG
jgi:hypothetical protein